MADTIKIGPTFASELVATGVTLIGLSWSISDGTIIASDGDDHLAAAEAVLAKHDPTKQLIVVPNSVSNYQARSLLIQKGLFSQVDNSLRQADQTVQNNQLALAAWDYANDYYRQSAFVESMGKILNLSDDQIDQMFIAASQII